MNSQENAIAADLLQEIKVCARQQPEKARVLSEVYKTLCAAYELRVRAEQLERGNP